jgi:hypothetical protein
MVAVTAALKDKSKAGARYVVHAYNPGTWKGKSLSWLAGLAFMTAAIINSLSRGPTEGGARHDTTSTYSSAFTVASARRPAPQMPSCRPGFSSGITRSEAMRSSAENGRWRSATAWKQRLQRTVRWMHAIAWV